MNSETKAKKSRHIPSIIAGVFLFVPRLIGSAFKFIIEAFAELKFVSWLSIKVTVKLSMYILVFVIGMALVFAVTDAALFEVFKLITA